MHTHPLTRAAFALAAMILSEYVFLTALLQLDAPAMGAIAALSFPVLFVSFIVFIKSMVEWLFPKEIK